MRYPFLTETKTRREMIDSFAGYNHNLKIGDGEFFDMTNMASDDYPVLSPRQKRGTLLEGRKLQGMIAKEALCYVDGPNLYVNGSRVEGLTLTEDNAPKNLVSMGAYIVIFPDKKYVNTSDLTDFGNLDAKTVTKGNVSFALCKENGESYGDVSVQATAPANPTNGQMWIDTSGENHVLKKYTDSTDTWQSVQTTYVKISSPGIGSGFSAGDGVTISGVVSPTMKDLNAPNIIVDASLDYIVVTGIIDVVGNQNDAVTVSREMPTMDFVIESGNRLWGCRYGIAKNGKVVNEIYASKLGDFKNWNVFEGISTDSYAVSVGTDGVFTGAVTHLGYPIFFKQNCMHKIYGTIPANFQVQTTACRGVQQGSHKSLAILNEVLFYKSQNAVCAYDGSLPAEISYALGDEQYKDAVATATNNKYYISMTDENGDPHLFVYDYRLQMWHREDNSKFFDACTLNGQVFYIEGEKIRVEFGEGENADTEPVKWSAETGNIGFYTPDKKYIFKMNVRMMIPIGSRIVAYIKYDSEDYWNVLYTCTGNSLRSFSIPIKPHRCDHFRIKFSGVGDAKIYSISKDIEWGSDK